MPAAAWFTLIVAALIIAITAVGLLRVIFHLRAIRASLAGERFVPAGQQAQIRTQLSLVLEGVHLVPGMVELPQREHAVSVFVVLSIEDEAEHLRHFHFREEDSERPESRYLERFDDIRRLTATGSFRPVEPGIYYETA